MPQLYGRSPENLDDNGPQLMVILWLEASIAILVMAARLVARFLIRKTSWDDFLMLLTLVLFLACCALATAQNSVGGYRHVDTLSESDASTALELNFVLRAVVILAYASGKAAIGVLLLRLIQNRRMWQKWLIWGVIILTTVVNILNCIFNFIQCRPVQSNWQANIARECWDPSVQLNFAYFMSCENTLADAIFALLPATFISKLQITFRQKITLSVLLGLSLMATVCGIVKTTELSSIANDPDFTWGEYGLTVWGISEVFVIIVCGSIPILKPLWDRTARSHAQKIPNHLYHATELEESRASRRRPRPSHPFMRAESEDMSIKNGKNLHSIGES